MAMEEHGVLRFIADKRNFHPVIPLPAGIRFRGQKTVIFASAERPVTGSSSVLWNVHALKYVNT
jgi:hypothetical protein